MKRRFLLFLVALFTLCTTNKSFAQSYLCESFDGSTFPPSGWTQSYYSSSYPWIRITSGSFPSASPHSGSGFAEFDSWDAPYGYYANLITPAINFSTYGATGSNQLSFWFYNYTCCGDYMTVYVNTSASLTGASSLATLALSGSTTGWHQYTYTLPSALSTSSSVYIMFYGYSYYGYSLYLDDVCITHIPPCSGTPTCTTSPTGSTTVCAGASASITGIPGSVASGQLYQWQSGTSATGPWTNIAGATNLTYSSPAITSCSYYRFADSCTASASIGYSAAVTICPGSPAYASVPYFQDFENWSNFCSTHDVPGGNWKNSPSYYDSSWRRDDEGWTYGGWNSYGSGYYPVNYWSPYPAGYKSGSHCARLHTTPDYGYYYYFNNGAGNLDLYLDCSGTTGSKLLQYYWINQSPGSSYTPYLLYNNDSLNIWLSTDAGVTFNEIYRADTSQTWKATRVNIPSNSATTIIRFKGKRTFNLAGYGYDYNYSDIGLDSVYVAPPCNSAPSAVTVSPSGTVTACAGSSYTLNVGGLPLAGGYTYNWQVSTNGGTTWGNIGDTTSTATTPNLWNSIQYRVQVQCAYAGSPVTSPATVINVNNAPSYAPSLPYVESFERYQNRCATADAFSNYTATYTDNSSPYSGYISWRREDQYAAGGWYYYSMSPPYCYAPVSIDSAHSARIESYYTYGGNSTAYMYHFVNCSSPSGNKELDFNYNMTTSSYSPPDSLIVSYSVDSGTTFTRLVAYSSGAGWSPTQRFPLPTNSPKTVVLFTAKHPLYYGYTSGIGLDAVKIIPPCTGRPTAGAIPSSTQCANKPFYVSVTGYSTAAGLQFQWQESPDNIIWANTSAGDTNTTAKITLSAAAYLRVIVTCSNSGQSDTTAPKYISMRPFYYCYCDPDTLTSGSQYDYIYVGFNNVAITKASTGDTILDNGNPTPIYSNPRVYAMYVNGLNRVPHAGYTNWDTLSRLSQRMYLDSLYRFYITLGSYSSFLYAYPINIYIDYDHSATFDATEKVFDHNNTTSSTVTPHATDTVRIPHTALVGRTGMRLLYGMYASDPLDPCGPPSYHYSEVQDYLVDIEYRPCNGPVTAGTAQTTDTAMCVGYTFRLTDTTHEYHQSGITWFWQSSSDGVSYTTMPGTTGKDTMTLTFSGTTWYRMGIVCGNSHDSSYSTPVKVNLAPPYKCYCYSMSIGGTYYDSSDIGAFTIGSFVINKKGPHVLNPVATGSHTNYTGTTIHLAIDSTYAVGVYHILRSRTHGDAKVTMFIDYNNNLRYDIPQERVWTGYTTATDWFITTLLTIPSTVIGGVPTGMRLIINNNVAPNVPSDSACGVYISGETQDYVVQFDNVWPTSVGTISGLENLEMYPNPTIGKFNVNFTANKTINKLQINVSNMTGQQVIQRSYTNTSGQFNAELDMTDQPRGIYFVEFVADGERMIRKLVVR